jgi:hypothetical protein
MECTFNDYAYLELSFIRVNSMGKLVIKAMYSDVAVEQTLEQLFGFPFHKI